MPAPLTLQIIGTGFNLIPDDNILTFNLGAEGYVESCTTTTLNVIFTVNPTSIGTLTASVLTPLSSGSAVSVAIVEYGVTVTENTDSRGITATTLVIAGTQFSATANENTVTFNLGAVGTVTSATTTELTITFSTQPTSTGSLTAVVAVGANNSGSAVQVATIVAVATVTENLTVMPRNVLAIYYSGPPPSASYFTRPFVIAGTGFNPVAEENILTFNKGAVGTVTAATATELTVEFALTTPFHLTNYPTSDGALTCNVESFGAVSNTATIATVIANAIVYPNEANALFYYNNLDLLYQGISEPYSVFTFGGELDPVLIRLDQVNLPITLGSVSAEVKKSGTLNINVNSLAGYGNGYFVILYYEFISVGNYESPVVVYDFTGNYGQSFSTSSTNDLPVSTNDIIIIHANLEEVGEAFYQTLHMDLYFTD